MRLLPVRGLLSLQLQTRAPSVDEIPVSFAGVALISVAAAAPAATSTAKSNYRRISDIGDHGHSRSRSI